MSRFRIPHRFPWALLGVTGLLLALGLLFVTSAAYQPTKVGYMLDPYKQVLWIALGLGGLAACLLTDYRRFASAAFLLYGASLAAIGACYLFPAVNGARRWIALSGSVKIQPSEFMKVVLPLVLARILANRRGAERFRSLLLPLALAAVPTLLVLKQPDLGTSLVFVPIVLVMLWVGGARTRHLGALVGLGLVLAVSFYFSPLIKPHQKARVDAFLAPSNTADQKEGFQLAQSKTAIGSGHWTGKGWRNGSQNYLGYVPFDKTDFIFAVIGEEWGLVGGILTLGLLFGLVAGAFGIARRTRDPFGRLVTVGLITPVAMQVLVNTGMTLGLVPITGMTLPLLSYGGSSMIATLAAIGLIGNVSMRQPIVLAPDRYGISLPK